MDGLVIAVFGLIVIIVWFLDNPNDFER